MTMRVQQLVPLLVLVLLAGCDRLERPVLAVQLAGAAGVVLADAPWEDARQLVAGEEFSCLLVAGRVQCWGNGEEGQLAVPDGLQRVTDIAAGDAHACAVNDGAVVCWGRNNAGQTTVPAGLGRVTAVAAGMAHSCALSAGQVSCWGSNAAGQATVPAGLGTVELIAAGKSRTCASASREVICWGNLAQAGPVRIDGIRNPVSLSVGATQVCAIHSRGMFCRNLETGQDTGVPQLFEPVALSSRGQRHCVVSPSGLNCWDADGKLGVGRGVSGEVLAVAVGAKHLCTLLQDRVHCVGKAYKGFDVLTPPPDWRGD